jgi:hypothetical protein
VTSSLSSLWEETNTILHLLVSRGERLTHIIIYNMLSPFASRNILLKFPRLPFFSSFDFFEKNILGLFCSPARAEHFPGLIFKKSKFKSLSSKNKFSDLNIMKNEKSGTLRFFKVSVETFWEETTRS